MDRRRRWQDLMRLGAEKAAREEVRDLVREGLSRSLEEYSEDLMRTLADAELGRRIRWPGWIGCWCSTLLLGLAVVDAWLVSRAWSAGGLSGLKLAAGALVSPLLVLLILYVTLDLALGSGLVDQLEVWDDLRTTARIVGLAGVLVTVLGAVRWGWCALAGYLPAAGATLLLMWLFVDRRSVLHAVPFLVLPVLLGGLAALALR
jgi:hypothetical protein